MRTNVGLSGKEFDPNQPRDEQGQWTATGESAESALDAANFIHFASEIEGFTKHGINRTIERGVSPQSLLDTVKNPIRIQNQANGTIRYIGSSSVVVLNPAGQVVSVWRK